MSSKGFHCFNPNQPPKQPTLTTKISKTWAEKNLGHGFEELWQAGRFKLGRLLDLILKTQLEKTYLKNPSAFGYFFQRNKKDVFFLRKLFTPVEANRALRVGGRATSKNEEYEYF